MNAAVQTHIPTPRIYVEQNGQAFEHVIEGTLFRKKTRNCEKTGRVTIIFTTNCVHTSWT